MPSRMPASTIAGLTRLARGGREDSPRFTPTVPTVLHIEDDHLWAEVTNHLLNEWPEVCHVGIAPNGREGVALCRERQPAIVLLDLGLPDIDGLAVLDQLNALPRPPRILLLTVRRDDALLYRLGSGGVAGLVWKQAHFDDHLRPALAAVAAGGCYFPPEVCEAVRRFRCSPDAFFKILSPCELRLVSRLALGLNDDDIAAETGRSCGTIRNHWCNIAGKLGLSGRHELKLWAATKGFGLGSKPAPPAARAQ